MKAFRNSSHGFVTITKNNMARILLTGGLGYIGSHTAFALLEAGYDVTIIDNCSNSTERVLERFEKQFGAARRPDFFKGDVRDRDFFVRVFSHASIDGVIHFVALKSVDESFAQRDEYFDVNVEGTRALCEVMAAHGVRRIVYSSSACVYGAPEKNPIPETATLQPTNPYGETKVACEKMLQEISSRDKDFSAVILRYFNPAGAHASGLIGEAPKHPANIAAVIMEYLRGMRDVIKINGADYETPDGTCVRDFIHVVDLAAAHIAALEFGAVHRGAHIYNVGTGRGFSVQEMITAFAAAANREIKTEVGPRRAGDVATAVADPTKINTDFGWHAERSLTEIAQSAVNWITQNPHGFED